MKLSLISHPLCPYVQRAVIALREKGAQFERIDIDLSNKPDWFLALSPLGKTPVLQVGATAVFESAVICEYLDETIAPVLHPADPLQRARHRGWIEFASTTLNAIWTYYTARDDAAFAQAQQALRLRLEQLEQEIGAGPWFAGERFSLVDAAFAPVFRYFEVFEQADAGDFFEGLPRLHRWRQALAQRPSVRAAVGADYPERLRAFIVAQRGVLGSRFEAAAV